MKITFHGAAQTVTGSQHLIEVNGHRLLLDCGLFQGRRKEAFALNRQRFSDGKKVDAVVLSHAHIDHSGNIPSLVKNGFQGDIFCTPATRDLCAVMLMDSAKIQERDVAFVNKRRLRQNKNLFEPLYTQQDAANTMQYFVSLGYNRRRQILPGVHLTFTDAGHMLGSANVLLDIEDKEKDREARLIFSGDIGRPDIPIIRDPAPMTEGADILIMESTYGNRMHPPYPETEKEIERIVNETSRRGGSIIIPAFAVGRTQQIVYALNKLYETGNIPAIPIFVDSPLATDVTSVFRMHTECYDQETRDFLLHDTDKNPFGFDTLRYTHSVEQSKELNYLKMPAVIISASGMLEHGRVLHHLRHRIDDHRNTVLITGWQAPNTLGRKLVEGVPFVGIFGEEYAVKAKIEVLLGLSGHADRQGLFDWAASMRKKPTRTFIVHGEENSAAALAEALRNGLGFGGIDIPQMQETYDV